ncbi:MAG TPA: hypothetical protein VKU82_13525 [Planctomycetaceae bacterium]|nr:hypothetical protein [Planctomycetaceae bacterium]
MPTKDEIAPIKRQRRPFLFWVAVVVVSWAILYPLSFGPACWLDSRRKPEAASTTVSRPLNVFYRPIIEQIARFDNEFSDVVLGYAELFAADGRRAQYATLGPPGSQNGTVWLVWHRRDLRPGAWLSSTPTPDRESAATVDSPGPTSGAAPESN